MKGYGLALGGGGARGGYEIGVWKALKELEVPIDMVAGTSVGALNGAMIVQDDFEQAYELWSHIRVQDVIRIQSRMDEAEEKKQRPVDVLKLIKTGLSSGGLDVHPLQELVCRVVDEERIRSSPVGFGIVTFSLDDFQPVRILKEDIPKGKMADFLLASACFPAFKPHEIDNRRFIDGGVYDNIPISMIIERGFEKAIAVDLTTLGVVRKVDTQRLDLTYIQNSRDLGGILDFDSERSKKNIEMGYYDTLKSFGQITGYKYYILPTHVEGESGSTGRDLTLENLKEMAEFFGIPWSKRPLLKNRMVLKKIIGALRQEAGGRLHKTNLLMVMAEITAEELGVERATPYTFQQLVERIQKEYEHITRHDDFAAYIKSLDRLVVEKSGDFAQKVSDFFKEGKFLLSYKPVMKGNEENIRRLRRLTAVALPRIAIANLFIALMISPTSRKTDEIKKDRNL